MNNDRKQPPLHGSYHQPWEYVARELGDYDLEVYVGYSTEARMALVDSVCYVGDYVLAEKACKMILKLRDEINRLKGR